MKSPACIPAAVLGVSAASRPQTKKMYFSLFSTGWRFPRDPFISSCPGRKPWAAQAQEGKVDRFFYGGRGRVQRLFQGVATAGQDYLFEFDGSSLPNGVYLYRLTTETKVMMDKFMIAR